MGFLLAGYINYASLVLLFWRDAVLEHLRDILSSLAIQTSVVDRSEECEDGVDGVFMSVVKVLEGYGLLI